MTPAEWMSFLVFLLVVGGAVAYHHADRIDFWWRGSELRERLRRRLARWRRR